MTIAAAMAALSLGLSAVAAAAPVAGSCDVTTLSGTGGAGEDINNAGLIAGSRISGQRISEAVAWDKQGDATVLDQLPGGSHGNKALGINNAGQIVGEVFEVHAHPNPWFGSQSFGHAVTWDKGGVLTELPFLPGVNKLQEQTSAAAINDRGTIAGWASADRHQRAVIWTPTSGGDYTITRLGELPDMMLSQAADINNQGQVVGHALLNTLEGVAVTWDREGNPTVLPVPDGTKYPYATGINNKGEIVGTARVGGTTVGLVWTPVPGGGYTFSVLEDIGSWSAPSDINDAGIIIGRAALPTGATRAVLWTPLPGGGYTITQLCPLPGSGSSSGNAINNRGQVAGLSSGGASQVFHPVRWDTR